MSLYFQSILWWAGLRAIGSNRTCYWLENFSVPGYVSAGLSPGLSPSLAFLLMDTFKYQQNSVIASFPQLGTKQLWS